MKKRPRQALSRQLFTEVQTIYLPPAPLRRSAGTASTIITSCMSFILALGRVGYSGCTNDAANRSTSMPSPPARLTSISDYGQTSAVQGFVYSVSALTVFLIERPKTRISVCIVTRGDHRAACITSLMRPPTSRRICHLARADSSILETYNFLLLARPLLKAARVRASVVMRASWRSNNRSAAFNCST
jgi:hypothetical protein